MLSDIGLSDLKVRVETRSTFLLDVFAIWCHPCKLLENEIRKLSMERRDIDILRIDYDRNTGVLDYLGAGSIPLLVFYREGVPVFKLKGYHNLNVIKNELGSHGI